MAQRIRNVKVGDKFIVNAKTTGFEYGVIVESTTESKNILNKGEEYIRCKYVSGESLWKNLELWQKTVDLKRYKENNMSQKIVNIKAGQKFIIIDESCGGFEKGCIVEALCDKDNVHFDAGYFKWIGGYEPEDYNYKKVELSQKIVDLKRYRGKMK